MTLYRKLFENIVGKGENAGNQHFLLFPRCFLPFPEQTLIFQSCLCCHLATVLNFTQSKILSFEFIQQFQVLTNVWRRPLKKLSETKKMLNISIFSLAHVYFPFPFNSFPNNPWFLRVYSIGLLKTLWEKGKLLVTSNFSFSQSVFNPFG